MNAVKVLVVDDSVVIRKLLSAVIESQEDMEVCATAANGMMALNEVKVHQPDLITMDLDMPKMNGIETVRALRLEGIKTPIIMVSSETTAGARMTLDCLQAGADDFISKPRQMDDFAACLAYIEADLIPKLRAIVKRKEKKEGGGVPSPSNAPIPVIRPIVAVPALPPVVIRKGGQAKALLVASSTGGPVALNQFFESIGSNLPVPVLVVQHMPPHFTRTLAERLNEVYPLQFKECEDGEPLKAGVVYIAEGGRHMEVVRKGDRVCIRTHDGPMEQFCRPSADVLFRSAVQVYGGDLVAVILTGMGKDGTKGSEAVSRAGGRILVQDEASSVVWGMPGSVFQSGYADEMLGLDRIGRRAWDCVMGGQ
jgi:two-component system chemotaxis response regulator CheB